MHDDRPSRDSPRSASISITGNAFNVNTAGLVRGDDIHLLLRLLQLPLDGGDASVIVTDRLAIAATKTDGVNVETNLYHEIEASEHSTCYPL